MPGGNGPRWARQDKPRDLRAAMTGLLVYMGRERRALYAGILCALAATVLSLIGPQLLASITDSISGSILGSTPVDIGYVSRMGAILVVLYAASFLLSVGETRIIGAASERIGDRMRNVAKR